MMKKIDSLRGRAAAIALALLTSTAVAAQSPASASRPAASKDPKPALFAYDARADLGVSEVGVEKRDGATVHDIVFRSDPASKDETKAYLVVPDGAGPFAGALFVHWLGEPETTNRTEFLAEAAGLARQGLVSLLVDAMWSAPKWYESRVPDKDHDTSVRQVIAIRRAMDLLASQPNADKARLGFIGHDYGAMYGMLAAGADGRAKTYVYIAPTASLNDWAFFANQPESKAAYLCKNGDLELTDALRRVKNASTLLQYGTKDVYVSRASTAVLMGAITAPKERKVYETDHAMATADVRADRDAWLTKELSLAPAPTASSSPAATAATPATHP